MNPCEDIHPPLNQMPHHARLGLLRFVFACDEDMTSMHMTMLGESHGGQGDQQGFKTKKVAQILSGSSHQGGGPNQVRVLLGFHEQSWLKSTPKAHTDSVFDKPHIRGNII
jgi:hypothetical protein